jgi:hypothetical protein
VATNMDYSSGRLQWNISFVYSAHDWEVGILASFYSMLHCFRERRGEDKLCCIPSHKGIFYVSSFFLFLISQNLYQKAQI